MNFDKKSVSIEIMPSQSQPALQPENPQIARPSLDQPVRVVERHMSTRKEVAFHCHAWRQVALSDSGVVQVMTETAAFIIPSQHAVSIPEDVAHSAILLSKTRLFSVYIHLPEEEDKNKKEFWEKCKVIKVTSLLLELIRCLADQRLYKQRNDRYQAICLLIMDELYGSSEVKIGIPLPTERRLRTLCDLFLKDPRQNQALTTLARQAGASVSTVTRLFHDALGMSFRQWRQQALLARALALSAQNAPMQLIAEELGYASASAFSAMVSQAFGKPPRELLLSEVPLSEVPVQKRSLRARKAPKTS